MAFENLKENLSDIDSNVKSYIEHNREYYQLKTFKILMKFITSFTKMLLIAAIVLIFLFLISLAASYGIGQLMDNIAYGFAIVGLFYMIIGIIIFLLRNKLDKPLLRMFSNYYYDENDDT